MSPGREVVVPTRPSGSFGVLERFEADRVAFWPSRMVSLIFDGGSEVGDARSGGTKLTSSSF